MVLCSREECFSTWEYDWVVDRLFLPGISREP